MSRNLRCLGADETGLGLIEVLVSLALVVLTGIGVYAGLDAASGASGANKARAVAADLAQQDQERLRAFKVSDLSNLRATRTQDVAGVGYTVASRSDWITDTSGSASCSTNTSANYMKITSTVTWPQMHGLKPVVVDSIVAPPSGSFRTNQGSIGVSVLDRDGNPIAGRVVNISGAQSFSEVTNANGCVLLGYLTQGPVTITIDGGGGGACVSVCDETGNPGCTINGQVVGETTNNYTCKLDTPGAVNVTFKTRPFLNSLIPPALGAIQADRGEWAILSHTSLPSPGVRKFGNGSPKDTISTGTNVFPYASPYTAYAGYCSSAQPGTNGNATSPLDQSVTVTRGGTANVTVWEPAVNVLVTTLSGLLTQVPVVDARVVATSRECGDTVDMGKTNLFGQLNYPGLPFGTYDLCVEALGQSVRLNNVSNKAVNGTATLPIIIPAVGVFTPCPAVTTS